MEKIPNFHFFCELHILKRWQERFFHEFRKSPEKINGRLTLEPEKYFLNSSIHTYENKFPSSVKFYDLLSNENYDWDYFLRVKKFEFGGNGLYDRVLISEDGKFGYVEKHSGEPKVRSALYIYATIFRGKPNRCLCKL